MRLRFRLLVVLTLPVALVLGLSAPASAIERRFRDADNDVRNVRTDRVTRVAAGIDVRGIDVAFIPRGLRMVVHHKNLTNENAHDSWEDGILIDTWARNNGPEWFMWMGGFHYQLYKVDNYYQANNPKPRMKRFCGDKVSIDVRRDTTMMRMPDRCFPQVERLRVYGTFWSKERGHAARYDRFLDYRQWTDWVGRR